MVGGQNVNDNMEKSAESEEVQMDIKGGKKDVQSIEQSHELDGKGAQAEVAAEFADSAQKLDGDV